MLSQVCQITYILKLILFFCDYFFPPPIYFKCWEVFSQWKTIIIPIIIEKINLNWIHYGINRFSFEQQTVWKRKIGRDRSRSINRCRFFTERKPPNLFQKTPRSHENVVDQRKVFLFSAENFFLSFPLIES